MFQLTSTASTLEQRLQSLRKSEIQNQFDPTNTVQTE